MNHKMWLTAPAPIDIIPRMVAARPIRSGGLFDSRQEGPHERVRDLK